MGLRSARRMSRNTRAILVWPRKSMANTTACLLTTRLETWIKERLWEITASTRTSTIHRMWHSMMSSGSQLFAGSIKMRRPTATLEEVIVTIRASWTFSELLFHLSWTAITIQTRELMILTVKISLWSWDLPSLLCFRNWNPSKLATSHCLRLRSSPMRT